MTKALKYYININGSKFTLQEVRMVLNQIFRTIENVSSFTFDEIGVTEADPLVGIFPDRMVSFIHKDVFPHPTVTAIARGGAMFNIEKMDWMELCDFRSTLMHEILHNLGMPHSQIRQSVMTEDPFIGRCHRGLLFREDLQWLNNKAPKTDKPVGWISIDELYRIMIPSVTKDGEQWSAVLRFLGDSNNPGPPSDMVWGVSSSYLSGDGVSMLEKAALSDNGELHLEDVSFLGEDIGLVRFTISPDLKFRLIGT